MKSTNKTVSKNLRTAIFAGSFNPFTVGHASIVERGLQLFDRLIVAIGMNASKPSTEVEKSAARLRDIYADNPRVDIVIWKGLMADLAIRENAGFFLRGIRNVADFEYERNMAEINRRISGIDTVLLFTLPEHAAISSSVVRELDSYGVDVSDMVP